MIVKWRATGTVQVTGYAFSFEGVTHSYRMCDRITTFYIEEKEQSGGALWESNDFPEIGEDYGNDVPH